MMKLMPLALWLFCSAATAHEGHGLPGASHWHATDAVGVLMLALVVCAALWWRGRK